MGDDWKKLSVTDLYDIRSGLSKPRSAFGSGYAFLSFKDVLDNYFVPEELTGLVKSSEQERDQCSVLRGDVFLTRTSETMEDLGMSCVALKDYPNATFNGFTKRLRPKCDSVVPEYAAYYFRSPKFRQAVTAMSSLSTRASLNNEMIARLTILLPPKEIQHRIGDILKSLDDKIALNLQMTETLEVMARRLFKSWFVNFEPVRAKARLRREHPGLSNAELSRLALPHFTHEIAELFPDEFDDSELGPIPKGWIAARLAAVASNASITFDFNQVDEVIFINTSDVLDGRFLHSDLSPVVGLPGQAKKSIQKHDILFSEIRPANRRFAYVDFDAPRHVVSTKFMVIRGNGKLDSQILYRVLKSQETLDEFQMLAESRSGTFPQITFDSISHLPIAVASKEIQTAFQSLNSEIELRVRNNDLESRVLESTRDQLLSRLLSGSLHV